MPPVGEDDPVTEFHKYAHICWTLAARFLPQHDQAFPPLGTRAPPWTCIQGTFHYSLPVKSCDDPILTFPRPFSHLPLPAPALMRTESSCTPACPAWSHHRLLHSPSAHTCTVTQGKTSSTSRSLHLRGQAPLTRNAHPFMLGTPLLCPTQHFSCPLLVLSFLSDAKKRNSSFSAPIYQLLDGKLTCNKYTPVFV